MSHDCPKCFGKRSTCGKLPQCDNCEYLESCRFCSEDDGSSCNRRLGHISYDRYDYSKDIAEQSSPEATALDDSETRRIMEYLLDIDNYTAELLSEVLHGGCNTAADLARKFGVSRQAIHRKIVDCCTANPDLRKLFISRLYRCRRIMRNSKRLTEQAKRKHNPNQMEFNF